MQGGRMQERSRLLRRFGLAAAAAAVVALLLVLAGHWILALIVAIVAAVCGWLYLQARSVR